MKSSTESHGVARKGLLVDLRLGEEALMDDAGRIAPVNPGIGRSFCVLDNLIEASTQLMNTSRVTTLCAGDSRSRELRK